MGLKQQENGGSWALRSLIIYNNPQILLGWSNQGEWGGWDKWHTWARREKCLVRKLDGKRPLGNRGVDDNKGPQCWDWGVGGGVDSVCQDRDRWRALVNTVKKPRFWYWAAHEHRVSHSDTVMVVGLSLRPFLFWRLVLLGQWKWKLEEGGWVVSLLKAMLRLGRLSRSGRWHAQVVIFLLRLVDAPPLGGQRQLYLVVILYWFPFLGNWFFVVGQSSVGGPWHVLIMGGRRRVELHSLYSFFKIILFLKGQSNFFTCIFTLFVKKG
jgi:hypothetical protein